MDVGNIFSIVCGPLVLLVEELKGGVNVFFGLFFSRKNMVAMPFICLKFDRLSINLGF